MNKKLQNIVKLRDILNELFSPYYFDFDGDDYITTNPIHSDQITFISRIVINDQTNQIFLYLHDQDILEANILKYDIDTITYLSRNMYLRKIV